MRGRRRVHHAGEHLVPHRARPRADGAVAREPLLLRAGRDEPVDLAVAEVATARVAEVLRRELQSASDVHAAHRARLRDGPARLPVGRVDGEVLDGAPEVDERVVDPELARVVDAALDGDVAGDGHVVGQQAEAGNGRVVTDLGGYVVGARLEEHRLAGRRELVVLQLGDEGVHRRLDDRRVGVLVEDDDVGPEVGAGLGERQAELGDRPGIDEVTAGLLHTHVACGDCRAERNRHDVGGEGARAGDGR